MKKRTINESIIKNALDVIFEQNDAVSAIHTVLEMIGKHFRADRAYIFEDNIDHLGSRNTFEWCAGGIAPQKDDSQNVRFKDILGYPVSELFKENSVWYRSDFSKMEDGPLKRLLLKRNIKTAILVALFEYGDFAGFIGLDFMMHPKNWQASK